MSTVHRQSCCALQKYVMVFKGYSTQPWGRVDLHTRERMAEKERTMSSITMEQLSQWIRQASGIHKHICIYIKRKRWEWNFCSMGMKISIWEANNSHFSYCNKTSLPCWSDHICPSVEPRISVFPSLHHLHKIQLSCPFFQNPVKASPHLPPSLFKLAEWLLFISFHPSYLYEAEIPGEHLPDKVDQWLHSVLVQVPPFATLHPPLRTEWNYRRD